MSLQFFQCSSFSGRSSHPFLRRMRNCKGRPWGSGTTSKRRRERRAQKQWRNCKGRKWGSGTTSTRRRERRAHLQKDKTKEDGRSEWSGWWEGEEGEQTWGDSYQWGWQLGWKVYSKSGILKDPLKKGKSGRHGSCKRATFEGSHTPWKRRTHDLEARKHASKRKQGRKSWKKTSQPWRNAANPLEKGPNQGQNPSKQGLKRKSLGKASEQGLNKKSLGKGNLLKSLGKGNSLKSLGKGTSLGKGKNRQEDLAWIHDRLKSAVGATARAGGQRRHPNLTPTKMRKSRGAGRLEREK